MSLRVGSLFSGIGGFDLGLERAGMRVAWQCERDPAAASVLRRHWPHATLYDDVTTMRGADVAPVDLVCGGFPCQDLSVAGQRRGLAGGSSGLWFEFARILGEVQPAWCVVENVPGLLSSHGGKDLAVILDGLAAIGYIVDIGELNAMYHGLAQRRRRIFLIGRNVRNGHLTKTHGSANLLLTTVIESVRDALACLSAPSSIDADDWASSNTLAATGLVRRMIAFGNSSARSPWQNLPASLDAMVPQSVNAPASSASAPRDVRGPSSMATTLTSEGERASGNTSASWKTLWGDVSASPSVSTISTWSRQTTAWKISHCVETLVSIWPHIAALTPSCPCCCSAAYSYSTTLHDGIDLLKEASSGLFVEALWRDVAWTVLGRAERIADDIEQYRGDGRAAEILFESESLCRDSAPGRTPREGVASIFGVGSHAGSGGPVSNTSHATGGPVGMGIVEDGVAALRSGRTQTIAGCVAGGNYGAVNLDEGIPNMIARPLGAKKDGGWRGDLDNDTYVAFDPVNVTSKANRTRCEPGLPANTLHSRGLSVAHSLRADGFDAGEDGTGRGTGRGTPLYCETLPQTGVRRLTPREAERLQGFPDDWTRYRADGREQADGPRYKQLGNAVAVPVAEWIGRRIVAALVIL